MLVVIVVSASENDRFGQKGLGKLKGFFFKKRSKSKIMEYVLHIL